MNKRWSHLLKSFWVLRTVVRKGSFSAAAESLHVSQSAVSQHIRQLESEFGPLFERHGRQIQPTELCLTLDSYLRQGFSSIAEGVAAAGRRSQQITISVLPSFCSAWLMPRLYKFTEKHPEIEVRVTMSDELTDFSGGDIDAGISLSSGNNPDAIVRPLCDDEAFLVCSSELRKTLPEKLSWEDLSGQLLVHDDDDESYTWEAWIRASGQSGIKVKSRMMISDSSQVIRMALSNRCIALVRRVLVADELSAGSLVKLFDISLKLNLRYYFAMPPRSRGSQAVSAFYSWIEEEIRPYRREKL